MTALLETRALAFAFDPSLDTEEALATVEQRLHSQGVRDTTAADLQSAGVNILALAQRVEQSGDFDVAAIATLINKAFGTDRINVVLEGDTPTCDVDTGFFWLAEDRKSRRTA